ncbi:MAG: hypothetical protein AYP45_06505 [Candidatus Brocadia carolinensis]|uniref:Uncharacterized protein n=1 Tax=Candidatus Brocadia carolinensis TaxID=1004156 RepID=A0A1V4AUU1_9BACT|nr:MAG: hypothetical protein AYP45_06505 [Candidatus Brocadia caroliniensis]
MDMNAQMSIRAHASPSLFQKTNCEKDSSPPHFSATFTMVPSEKSEVYGRFTVFKHVFKRYETEKFPGIFSYECLARFLDIT